jgi:hypothetical protein
MRASVPKQEKIFRDLIRGEKIFFCAHFNTFAPRKQREMWFLLLLPSLEIALTFIFF